jgi:tRNA threonylcarbamoyladenosine biosynthesis protein TsaE
LGESKFPGPGPHLGHQLVATELSLVLHAVDRHHPIVESATLLWPDEAATQAFAQHWAAQPALAHAFVALHGDLGAGKTTLVRHLLQALGVTGRIKSPTYAVVEPYELDALNIWHFDFYRFNDPREWEEAGFRDIFASPGLKLAEWPEKAAGVLPVADVDLHIRTLDDSRRSVTLQAHTAAGQALLHTLPGATA